MVIKTVGDVKENQPRAIRCYNYKGEGHIAKHYTAKKKDDEATTSAIFMSSLSPARSINGDTIGPTHDSNILFEVPHYETYHETVVLNSVAQETKCTKHLVSNNDSYDEITSDINVITYADYMVTIKNDNAQYVSHPKQDNAMILSVLNK
nr:hypothetical protein [Tanacetum cinerariifolium]